MKYENNKIIYEIGDWVKVTGLASHWKRREGIGEIFQIDGTCDLYANGIKDEYSDIMVLPDNKYRTNIRGIDVRPATQQEIEETIRKQRNPVYKVGDWITIIERSGGANRKYQPGTTWQIEVVETTGIWLGDAGYHDNCRIRPATLEEVKKAINKTEFKVGDWVHLFCKDTQDAYIFEISGITEDRYETKQYYCLTDDCFRKSVGVFLRDVLEREYRYATVDEIMKANLAEKKLSEVKIRGHKVERSGNNSITIGCKTFSISDINQVYRILDDYGISEVTLDELKKIRYFIYRD